MTYDWNGERVRRARMLRVSAIVLCLLTSVPLLLAMA
jgi:hypothetical protein